MDFADATLLVLAEETGIDNIFTLDVRGFQMSFAKTLAALKRLTFRDPMPDTLRS